VRVWLPWQQVADGVGPLPGVEVEIFDGSGALPSSADEVEVYVPPFLAVGPAVEVMARLPRLRLVQLLTAGYDSVAPYVPTGVSLCSARGAHDVGTAEWCVAAMLAAQREIPRFVRAQAERRWDFGFTGTLSGSTVLIVGYGSIGSELDRQLAGFGVTMLRVASRARDGIAGVEDLPDLLGRADIVVVLVPLLPSTTRLVDAAFLAAMKPGALLVNGARGPVVDTEALLLALRAGRVRAALDVTDPEPLPAEHPLWDAPGLLITPHVGGATPLSTARVMALVRDQIARCAAGEPLRNVVATGSGPPAAR